MTQGYPDFQRVVQQSADPVFATTTFLASTVAEQGPFYVGNWQYLALFAQRNNAGANGFQIIVRFYADEALTQLLSVNFWSTRTTIPIIDKLGVVGQWVTFQIVNDPGLVNDRITIRLSPFTATGGAVSGGSTGTLMSIANQATNPANSAAAFAAYVSAGLYTVTVHVNSPTTNPYLDTQIIGTDDGGTTRVLWGVVLQGAILNMYATAQVYLPGLVLSATCFNRSANVCNVDLLVVEQV